MGPKHDSVDYKPDPVHEFGDIEYDCPHFIDCVERVALSAWEYWTCSGCAYKDRFKSCYLP
jgi:hypothetical protein